MFVITDFYSEGLRTEPHVLEVTGRWRAEVSEERRGAGAVNERYVARAVGGVWADQQLCSLLTVIDTINL